ncbi:hypothetical protein AS890_15690 [Rhizobium anhuiense bv. trifolii]|nr:hypothetical protein AS890_15690 [Rhizobium anhuiense bv. trifolii]
MTRDHQLIEKTGGVIIASRGTVSTWADRMSSGGFSRSLFSAGYAAWPPTAAAITATDTKETVRAHCMASSDIATAVAKAGDAAYIKFP